MPKLWEWTEEERAQAEKAHAEFYMQVMLDSDKLYKDGNENALKALALFDAEFAHIRAGQQWAADNAERDNDAAWLCSAYPDVGAYVANLRLDYREQILWWEQATSAARRLRDERIEAAHLNNLGEAYRKLGDVAKAIGYYEQALAINRVIAKASRTKQEWVAARRSEGNELGNMGLAYSYLGQAQKAIQYHEQALAIHHEIGDKREEGADLGNLGLAYVNLGDSRKAVEYYKQALSISHEIGDLYNEGIWLCNLGEAYHRHGEIDKAIAYYEHALTIRRMISDKHGQAVNFGDLGLVKN